MEIVIESDQYRPSSTSPAPTYLRSPVTTQPVINSNNAFYYATLPRGNPAAARHTTETPDGAPPINAVRRVDKSGLLEIADLEPANRQTCSRHLTGAENHGTLSRRIERSGLLEAVPELPDQIHRPSLASDELMAAAATARSMVERQQHLLGAETDIVESALLRRRSFANEPQDSSTSISTDTEPPPTRSTQRVKFQDESSPAKSSLDEIKEPRKPSVVECLARLSPRQRQHAPVTLSNVPDVIEAHGTSATTTTTATTASSGGGKGAPEGERAEAEGCEHTAIESVEEARVSYKGSNATSATSTGPSNTKIGHNDNIQAVHVIILSEQL